MVKAEYSYPAGVVYARRAKLKAFEAKLAAIHNDVATARAIGREGIALELESMPRLQSYQSRM